MRNRLTIFIVTGLLSLLSLQSQAHAFDDRCENNCFNTTVVNAESLEGGCTTFELLVSTNGTCKYALSHFSVGIPECAEIVSISNSESWKIEKGTDPTTGISGFKIDDISNFGEGEFRVTYTLCAGSCEEAITTCQAPEVAYKASTCVFYEQTEYDCSTLEAELLAIHNNCAEDQAGSLEAIIIDGVEPFSYLWSNGSTATEINNLAEGVYSVVITDNTGEQLELSGEITAPTPISIEHEITNASCSGQNDGSIVPIVTGGSAPYTYSWSNGTTTANNIELRGGYYILSVTDANGCQASEPAIVENTVFININAVVNNTSCQGADGSLDVSVDGGTAPYTYSWNTGQTTEDLENLVAGSYRVTISDANGCASARTFYVRENNPVRISAITQPTACVDDSSGAIDITISGGSEPYTFLWSDGSTQEDKEGLAAGNYSVTVTDNNGCSVSSSFSIKEKSFNAYSLVSNISCQGADDAAIELLVSDGVEPYTYAWSHGPESSEVTGLAPGTYSVVINDAAGCSKTLYYTIMNPSAITANFSVANASCAEGNYAVTVSASGGAGNYTYTWSNGETSATISAINAGVYTVEITDRNGCTNLSEIDVNLTAAECNDDQTDDNPDDTTDDDTTGDDTDGGSNDDSTDGDDSTGDNNDDSDTGDNTGGENDDDSSSGNDDGGDSNGEDDGSSDEDPGDDDPNNEGCMNPYETEIEVISQNDNCTTYKAIVSYSGVHSKGLSHWTFSSSCGVLGDISNSENWSIEKGKDPTTGLNGFKVDNIHDFGEGSYYQEFEVYFTVCSDNPECIDESNSDGFTVAYKYGQCVSYEDLTPSIIEQNEYTHTAYPNPFSGTSTIEVYSSEESPVTVDIYNSHGLKVKELYRGTVGENETLPLNFDAYNLPGDVYTYVITTNNGIATGKLVLMK